MATGIDNYLQNGSAEQKQLYGRTIDDSFIQQLMRSQNPVQFLIGETSVGAQQQGATQEMVDAVNKRLDEKLIQATQQLKAINPAFDPKNYYIDPNLVWNPGEGASANRSAPAVQAQIKAALVNQAIALANQAAQTYQQTGKVTPPPKASEIVGQAWQQQLGATISDGNFLSKVDANVKSGISEEQKSQLNAAAARVGSPLPYPQSSIGQIVGGGAITDQNVGQAYKNGQLTQQGQQFITSSAPNQANPGFAAGGTGAQQTQQATINPQNQAQIQAIQQQLTSGIGANGQALTAQQKQSLQNQLSSLQGSSGSSTGSASGTSTSATTPTPATVNGSAGDIQAALDIINNSGLDAGQKMLFQQIVKDWNPDSEINVPNIISKFNEIKNTTIDPYFKEQSNIFIDQIKNTYNDMQQGRNLQLEQEDIQKKQDIRNTQNDLEARGMTFSGEGVRQLGANSAYAQPGQNPNNAIPTQEQMPGGGFAEGLVNTQNRMISSSSQAQYQKNLRDLSRQAETTLGTQGSSGLVPGVSQLGGIEQSAALPYQKKQAEASTLTNLYGQAQDNYNQNQTIKPYNQ